MPRPYVAVFAILVGIAIAACSPDGSPPRNPYAPQGTPTLSVPVEGVVIAVDTAGLDHVNGFTIRTSSGETLTFVMGTLENASEFPPSHLIEHKATASPVRVWFTPEADGPVVYRIEDAGESQADRGEA